MSALAKVTPRPAPYLTSKLHRVSAENTARAVSERSLGRGAASGRRGAVSGASIRRSRKRSWAGGAGTAPVKRAGAEAARDPVLLIHLLLPGLPLAKIPSSVSSPGLALSFNRGSRRVPIAERNPRATG